MLAGKMNHDLTKLQADAETKAAETAWTPLCAGHSSRSSAPARASTVCLSNFDDNSLSRGSNSARPGFAAHGDLENMPSFFHIFQIHLN